MMTTPNEFENCPEQGSRENGMNAIGNPFSERHLPIASAFVIRAWSLLRGLGFRHLCIHAKFRPKMPNDEIRNNSETQIPEGMKNAETRIEH
jgi:hypothetical protein